MELLLFSSPLWTYETLACLSGHLFEFPMVKRESQEHMNNDRESKSFTGPPPPGAKCGGTCASRSPVAKSDPGQELLPEQPFDNADWRFCGGF